MGPTRYCGAYLYSAVYHVILDFPNVTAPPDENVTVLPNITILNVTPAPEIPLPKDPLLQFTEAENFQPAPSGDTWLLEPDVAKLLAGRRYRLCTDLDGNLDSRLRVGDTGLSVYLSPITAVYPTTLESTNISQQLILHCGYDGCALARLRSAYLSTGCNRVPAADDTGVCFANYTMPPPMGAPRMGGGAPPPMQPPTMMSPPMEATSMGGGVPPTMRPPPMNTAAAQEHTTSAGEVKVLSDGTAMVLLDTRCLPPGRDYRLCLLSGLDSMPIGEDTGFSVTLIPESLVAYS